ncbi:glycosyltransferase family 4 protein [Fulvivirgaceae bacterium PWU37]|uniref:Glycosyltransferase family 4 protein n=2 Tax=Dawidia soli TaxID=2782352 RepID=A0AAP2GEG0_9BACT|nr:glycosyltransferase family 4 protein [Dawidia soli]
MLLPETLRLHDREAFDFHYIFFLPWKTAMVGAIEENGGKVTCLPAKNNIQLLLKARALARYIRQHKIELVHAHLPWAGVVARLAGKMTGIPVMYTEHNKQERYHLATRVMNLATMNLLGRVIAVSADVEESIRKHKPNLKAPLETILNGVNTERFTPHAAGGTEVRAQFGIPADAPVIGTIAVFRFQKRLDVWLEVAARVLKEEPRAHFILVGDGPLRPQLEEKWRQLGLEKNAHFVGVQTEVRPYLAAFDLYMMSSIFEGLPIALLEAMASGCAIVSTDAGGIKEVIRHEKDGLLCGVDEPMKLVSFAQTLLKDGQQRKRLAEQGRKRIEESFSLETMVAGLERVYHEFVKR